MDRLLELLEENSRLKEEELALMLGKTKEEIEAAIEQYEKDGIIKGYRTMLNYEKLDEGRVVAQIELKVAPKKDVGFDEVARIIAEIPEVEGVWLISGGYDLLVTISGESFQEIANFVARRLSPIDAVLSTATHFVLNTYKKDNVMYAEPETDERGLYR